MKNITIKDDYIKLGQAMKLSGVVMGGGEAKEVISEGLVEVNGETETRRGRKLFKNDEFSYNGEKVKIV